MENRRLVDSVNVVQQTAKSELCKGLGQQNYAINAVLLFTVLKMCGLVSELPKMTETINNVSFRVRGYASLSSLFRSSSFLTPCCPHRERKRKPTRSRRGVRVAVGHMYQGITKLTWLLSRALVGTSCDARARLAG